MESNGVVSTEWSNLGLGAYLQQHGFSHYQSKVGERYVIDLMKEKSVCLGGESVGHIVLSRYAKSGDALVTSIILALAYLEEQKQLSEIFPIFQPYPCLIENIRFSSKEAMSDSVEHEDVKQALAMAKQDLGSQSTVIARKSGTEPVIKLRIEGKDADLVQKNMQKLRDLISSYQK